MSIKIYSSVSTGKRELKAEIMFSSLVQKWKIYAKTVGKGVRGYWGIN